MTANFLSSIPRWATVLTLAFVLTACGGGGLNADQFGKVEQGMTEEQVKSLIGDPTKIESGSMLGVSGTTYIYEDSKTKATVSFVNGKVMGKQFSQK